MPMSLGIQTLGEQTLGGSGFYDPPVVSNVLATPGNGPEVTVTWTYFQNYGIPQLAYRVEILDSTFTDLYYDSGILSGANTSYDVDLTVIPELIGILESEFYEARVTVYAETYFGSPDLNASTPGTDAFTANWGQPSVNVTAPIGTVSTSTITVTWSYSDSDGHPQDQYRIRILGADSGAELYDTNWVESAVASAAIPFPLQDDSDYNIELQVRNDPHLVFSAIDLHPFTVDLVDAVNFNPLDTIGSLYDIGINGIGYILADHPEKQIEYKRGTINLDPQRINDGNTQFNQSVERYWLSHWNDLSGGAGQKFQNRDRTDTTAFNTSLHLDPLTNPGEIRLAPALGDSQSVGSNATMAFVGNRGFFQSATNSLKHTTDPAAAPTTLSGITDATGAVTISDLTTDGQYWYAATGRSVIRGLLSNPAADWSTQDAVRVKWAANRIIAAVKSGSSTTPNRLTSLTPTGTEERTNGHLTLDEGQSIELGGSAAGHFYFGSSTGATSQVHAWKLGLDEAAQFFTPFTAWELPRGLVVDALDTAGGQVWVRAFRTDDTEQFLYRLVPSQDGSLTPFLVAELGPTNAAVGTHRGGFTSMGDWLWVGVPGMSSGGDTGYVGMVSLASGGYVKLLEVSGSGTVQGVGTWYGRLVTNDGTTMRIRSKTQHTLVGELQFSTVDAGTNVDKVWDDFSISTRPLPDDECFIDIEVSTNGGDSFVALGTHAGIGLTNSTFTIAKKSPNMTIRISMVGDGTDADFASPVIVFATLRYHQLGLVDTLVVLPIDCADELRTLNDYPHPDSGPGKGALRARHLASLSQSRVLLQDIDYPSTGAAEVYEVISTEIAAFGLVDKASGHKRWRQVCTVTLRKVGAS